jgi:hypothetical protein
MKVIMKQILLASLMVMGASVVAAQVSVDPGLSTHNYKHPNKAKKAAKEKNSFEVPTLSAVKKQENAKMTHRVVTPKYTTRHSTLVAAHPVEGSGVKLNPMKAPGNYKAGSANAKKDLTEVSSEGYTSSKDSLKNQGVSY